MKRYEWFTIAAIIVGPVAAVQVRKWVERICDSRGRKLGIFKALTATPATVLSPDHVHALNMSKYSCSSGGGQIACYSAKRR